MSKKFGFISGIDDDTKHPKTKFQVFEAEIGFEHVEVLIPFDHADKFVEETQKLNIKSVPSLNKLAGKFGGKVQ